MELQEKLLIKIRSQNRGTSYYMILMRESLFLLIITAFMPNLQVLWNVLFLAAGVIDATNRFKRRLLMLHISLVEETNYGHPVFRAASSELRLPWVKLSVIVVC